MHSDDRTKDRHNERLRWHFMAGVGAERTPLRERTRPPGRIYGFPVEVSP
jgi:hypothetical protein